jgi:hypothetical protein
MTKAGWPRATALVLYELYFPKNNPEFLSLGRVVALVRSAEVTAY